MQPSVNRMEDSASASGPRRLNIGCGRQYHRDWCNLDLETDDANVLQHDVTQGIPFSENYFDVVYHSHVLEHLKPENGVALLRDCYRVLRPGGVLRVVVPDLEGIARLYLEMHAQAWDGNEQAKTDYNWIKLELLDQLVREYSGGRMGRYMANPEIQNSEFVRSRVGDEFWICRSPESAESNTRKKFGIRQRLARWSQDFRERMVRRTTRLLLGKSAEVALDEGLFRSRGEIHRWMYDRFSLSELCGELGFESFEVMRANTSKVKGFDQFELDIQGTTVRKPDSLFIECVKPRLAVAKAA